MPGMHWCIAPQKNHQTTLEDIYIKEMHDKWNPWKTYMIINRYNI